jgi:hypothetical protein
MEFQKCSCIWFMSPETFWYQCAGGYRRRTSFRRLANQSRRPSLENWRPDCVWETLAACEVIAKRLAIYVVLIFPSIATRVELIVGTSYSRHLIWHFTCVFHYPGTPDSLVQLDMIQGDYRKSKQDKLVDPGTLPPKAFFFVQLCRKVCARNRDKKGALQHCTLARIFLRLHWPWTVTYYAYTIGRKVNIMSWTLKRNMLLHTSKMNMNMQVQCVSVLARAWFDHLER